MRSNLRWPLTPGTILSAGFKFVAGILPCVHLHQCTYIHTCLPKLHKALALGITCLLMFNCATLLIPLFQRSIWQPMACMSTAICLMYCTFVTNTCTHLTQFLILFGPVFMVHVIVMCKEHDTLCTYILHWLKQRKATFHKKLCFNQLTY